MRQRMTLGLFLLLLGTTLLSLVPTAGACVYTRQNFPFECGPGLPCHYTQYRSLCVLGGCKDCLEECGSGQCTCGGEVYRHDCLVPCDAGPEPVTDPSGPAMAALVAVPDCQGFYRRAGTRAPKFQKNIPDLDRIEIPR